MTTARTRTGFTLIEVLIGVLILALGVLGLGAIIPVIVREQRQAADVTLGAAAANTAAGNLASTPGFDPKSPNQTVWDGFLDNGTPANNRWSKDGQWSSIGSNNPQLRSLFYHSSSTRDSTQWNYFFDESSGQLRWVAKVTPQSFNFQSNTWVPSGPLVTNIYMLPVASRLWPGAATQPVDTVAPDTDPYRPQFVWDIVCRRVPVAAGEAPRLQVALFVRRIDLNIRIPRTTPLGRPATLLDVLTDWPNTTELCVPVAMDRTTSTNQNRTTACGLPTNRGTADGFRYYASPIYIGAKYDITKPDQIQFPQLSTTTSDPRWLLVSQIGQKILDNLGNVYTVRGPVDDGSPAVYIDPTVPGWVPDDLAQDPPNLPGLNPAKINQVVFTPQIPAAVQIINITRPSNY